MAARPVYFVFHDARYLFGPFSGSVHRVLIN